MADLYANENFPLAVVDHLREMGHNVLTSLEAGRANQRIPDEDVLAFATSVRRAVLTHNRADFKRLHRSRNHHEGIVVCTVDIDFQSRARRIDDSLQRHKPLASKLIRVNRS